MGMRYSWRKLIWRSSNIGLVETGCTSPTWNLIRPCHQAAAAEPAAKFAGALLTISDSTIDKSEPAERGPDPLRGLSASLSD